MTYKTGMGTSFAENNTIQNFAAPFHSPQFCFILFEFAAIAKPPTITSCFDPLIHKCSKCKGRGVRTRLQFRSSIRCRFNYFQYYHRRENRTKKQFHHVIFIIFNGREIQKPLSSSYCGWYFYRMNKK